MFTSCLFCGDGRVAVVEIDARLYSLCCSESLRLCVEIEKSREQIFQLSCVDLAIGCHRLMPAPVCEGQTKADAADDAAHDEVPHVGNDTAQEQSHHHHAEAADPFDRAAQVDS